MTFAKAINPPATDGLSTITGLQINTIDTNQSLAVDGAAGGGYSPTGTIAISGASITLAGQLLYQQRDVTRHMALLGYYVGATWGLLLGGTVWRWYNSVANNSSLWLPLESLPHGQNLDTVTIRIVGAAAARGGAPPGAMPQMQVWRIDQDGAATTLTAGWVVDVWVDEATYELPHNITRAGMAHVIDRDDYRYVVEFQHENAGNSFPNGEVLSLLATVRVTAQAEM